MLSIKNLHVRVADKAILHGINLEVGAGEVHAVMGPNGSGKSTLAGVLAGRESHEVTDGEVQWHARDLLEMSPETRAREGLFLAFQYPVEIPGVTNLYLLKAAVNAARKHRGEDEISSAKFLQLAKQQAEAVGMPQEFLYRSVNAGFSGGEKKRNEVLQMLLLQPQLGILDETDSGLDIDALKTVARGVNTLRDKSRALIVVTHYQRLLDYITPDYVHVLAEGKIVRSGDKSLAHELEREGYAWIEQHTTKKAS